MINKKYPEVKNFDERTKLAILLFHEIAQGISLHGWNISFLSGFSIDAQFGYITKNHKDLDIIISKSEAPALVEYLTSLGHTVCEAVKYKGECLKVDQSDPQKETQSSCDVHYYWEEDGKVVIPLLGKKLTFSGSFSEITEKKVFLNETILALKPQYLLEEKKGWCEQVGLSQCKEKPDEYNSDIEKISSLLENVHDESFGVIPVYFDSQKGPLFCIVHHTIGHWSFPKGHANGNESEQATGLRELYEETGIQKVTLFSNKKFIEIYSFKKENINYKKSVKYFVGQVFSTETEIPNDFKNEVDELKWVDYGEAKSALTFSEAKKILDDVFIFLKKNKFRDPQLLN